MIVNEGAYLTFKSFFHKPLNHIYMYNKDTDKNETKDKHAPRINMHQG